MDLGMYVQHAFRETYCGGCGNPESSAEHGADCLRYDPDPARDVIAAGGCWCGEDHGHDWPGKTEGAPHPRKEGTT